MQEQFPHHFYNVKRRQEWEKKKIKERKKKKPGLSLQSVASLFAAKCTKAKLISSIIPPVTLGYNSDEFGFGVFGCSVLEKKH